jgi:fused signal recognition particle receptor
MLSPTLLLDMLSAQMPEVPAAAGLTSAEWLVFGLIGLALVALVARAIRPRPRPSEPSPRAAAQTPAPLPLPPVAPTPEPVPAPVEVPKPAPAEAPKAAPVEVPKPAPAPAPKPAPAPAPKPVPKPAPVPAPVPAPEAPGLTLREGLARTHDGFVSRLGQLFTGGKQVDDALLGEIEETLFTADIGVRTSQKLLEQVHESLSRKALRDPNQVWQGLKASMREMLQVAASPVDLRAHRPLVIMVVGVNGSGKTTTIGKLAHQFSSQGLKVVVAAGDTFRAAAVEQLAVWADRAQVPVIRGKDGQDPSSVIFDACKRAADEGFDVCLCDTAGRLQSKKELMDELTKVHRSVAKAVPGAPHEVWLVLDSTNGQNAISQAREFTQAVQVTGLVLTKLDGTAKGGVVIGICDEMRLPVRYIGIGEKVGDLRPFDPAAFADALLGD